jgi:hypothetical protein
VDGSEVFTAGFEGGTFAGFTGAVFVADPATGFAGAALVTPDGVCFD